MSFEKTINKKKCHSKFKLSKADTEGNLIISDSHWDSFFSFKIHDKIELSNLIHHPNVQNVMLIQNWSLGPPNADQCHVNET